MLRLACGCTLFVIFATLGSTANAQGPNTYGYGGSWYGPPYTYYQQEHIPYFALHPPVYYSLPVPRTYGYSPFAYPPGTMTPEVITVDPLEIRNPYAPSTGRPEPVQPRKTSNRVTVIAPKIIVNPFVAQPATVAQSAAR